MAIRLLSKWQSLAETLAIIVIAVGVGRVSFLKPTAPVSPTREAGPRRPRSAPVPTDHAGRRAACG